MAMSKYRWFLQISQVFPSVILSVYPPKMSISQWQSAYPPNYAPKEHKCLQDTNQSSSKEIFHGQVNLEDTEFNKTK